MLMPCRYQGLKLVLRCPPPGASIRLSSLTSSVRFSASSLAAGWRCSGTSLPQHHVTTGRRLLSSNSSTTAQPSSSSLYPTVLLRVAAGLSLLSLVDEYGLSVIQCEGPSMLPTVQPLGEMIVIERVTHRLYGLDGGHTEEERRARARIKQWEWERSRVLDNLSRVEKNKHTNNNTTYNNNNNNHNNLVGTWHPQQRPNDDTATLWDKIRDKFTTGICVGDVVVVQHPLKDGTVCKRVVGLPGDVMVRSRRHHIPYYHSNKKSLTVVPDGHVWIEGDNTPNSRDSRDYGAVPAALVMGKVVCRLWRLRGRAWIDRCRPDPHDESSFTGSMAIPAGYEGERVNDHVNIGGRSTSSNGEEESRSDTASGTI